MNAHVNPPLPCCDAARQAFLTQPDIARALAVMPGDAALNVHTMLCAAFHCGCAHGLNDAARMIEQSRK
jgi:hypothetical protein